MAHVKLVYEGLTRLDDDLNTVPAAAETWYFNDAGDEVTFIIHEGLTYSDGSLLNALRFEYSILRTIDPATASEYAVITDDIRGAVAWRTSDMDDSLKSRVAVHAYKMDSVTECYGYEDTECRILVVGTEAPASHIATVLSLWIAYPVKEEIIATDPDYWWLDAGKHIGNGPYVMEELVEGEKALFVPDENYWGEKGQVKIQFSYLTDTGEVLEDYKDDGFDIIPVTVENMPEILADEELSQEVLSYAGSCTFVVMMNQLKEPFNDKKVREAFAYALDREEWARDGLNGQGLATLTWIPPGLPGHDPDEARYAYDPDRALQMLAESSYGSAENLPEVVMSFSDTSRNQMRYGWLAAHWGEVFGREIGLNPVEPGTFYGLFGDIETTPQAYISGWCADYPDPQNWLSTYWRTGAFASSIGYSNPGLDELMAAADAEFDPERRMELYFEAQRMLVGDCPGVFFWNNINSYLVKPYVKGIRATTMDSDWAGSNNPRSITID